MESSGSYPTLCGLCILRSGGLLDTRMAGWRVWGGEGKAAVQAEAACLARKSLPQKPPKPLRRPLRGTSVVQNELLPWGRGLGRPEAEAPR